MFKLFNTNDDISFTINNYEINTPLNILLPTGEYLSCAEYDNRVDFFHEEGIRQSWIIEQDLSNNDFFYIKTAFVRYNCTHYLGAPNQDGIVYLYTSKNKYTRWSIKNINDNNYTVQYFGEKFDKNKIEMVVARYNENIKWALAYNDIVTVYNKGIDNIIGINNVINLPNFGREGNTYLNHIVKNYNYLNDKTVFTQGSPFEHNNTFLFGVDNFEKMDNIQPLSIRWLENKNIPPVEFIEKYKTTTDYGLEYLRAYCDSNLLISEFNDDGINLLNINAIKYYPQYKNIDLVTAYLYRSKFPYVKSLDKRNNPHKKSVDKIYFNYSGLFAVDKQNIMKFDIDVYKNLLLELTSVDDQGGTNGYVLERLWLYIFE